MTEEKYHLDKEEIQIGNLLLRSEFSVRLPASKSIHNRATVINHLAEGTTQILNPSNARDSRLMDKLISENDATIDARDAGTTFRFLTAYYSLKGEQRVLTGTERMKQRPIGPLVEALRALGARIQRRKVLL